MYLRAYVCSCLYVYMPTYSKSGLQENEITFFQWVHAPAPPEAYFGVLCGARRRGPKDKNYSKVYLLTEDT